MEKKRLSPVSGLSNAKYIIGTPRSDTQIPINTPTNALDLSKLLPGVNARVAAPAANVATSTKKYSLPNRLALEVLTIEFHLRVPLRYTMIKIVTKKTAKSICTAQDTSISYLVIDSSGGITAAS